MTAVDAANESGTREASRRRKWSRWGLGAGWLLGPFAVGVLVLLVIPAALNLAFAFTNNTGLGGGQFTGLANVRRALSDPQLASALRASLIH
ncbi:MAG: multiple sugar transport system permease protein, partial [Glaciecola sp.]